MRRATAPLVTLAALLLAACAGAPPKAPLAREGAVAPPPAESADPTAPAATERAPFSALVARLTEQAGKQEEAGDLPRALDSWKSVAALRPRETEPRRRVAQLRARIETEAERRYRNGLARLKEGSLLAARRELLLALAADPDHAGALDTLKNQLEPDATPYTAAAGDSFESIAKKQYGDAAKAALVARANGLDPGSPLAPGTTLSIPDLTPPAKPATGKRGAAPAGEAPESAYDTEPAALAPDTAAPPVAAPATPPIETLKAPDLAEELLAKASGLFRDGKHEEAAAAAEKLTGNAAVGKRARELAGNAWFAIGDAALKADQFTEAVTAYRKAEPSRKDAAAAVAAVERRKKEKAEQHYKAGVNAFINQKLDEAIASWEQTLALNQEHPKAAKDIEKARALQQKLKDLR